MAPPLWQQCRHSQQLPLLLQQQLLLLLLLLLLLP
jgi:hypothetical protein